MPKVSVVIPVYNVEKYLGECLDSVLRQTLKDLEIICVDDGSTDGSAAILRKYAEADPRIRLISQANAGLSAARNAGMDAATGKYIYFLDSDDYISGDAMEKCLSICERDELDQLVFGCQCLFEDPGMSESECRRKERGLTMPEETCGRVFGGAELQERLCDLNNKTVCVPFRFFRLAFLRDSGLRFCEGLVHEDDYFSPLATLASQRVKVISERFYFRRYCPGSIVTRRGIVADARRLASRIAIYRLHKKEFKAREYVARHPGLTRKFFRAQRSRLVGLTTPVRAAAVPFVMPRAARSQGGVSMLLLLASLATHHLVRKARRLLCPKK